MDKIKTEYRGIVIEFDVSSEEWCCELAERKYRKVTLADTKKKIDAFLKTENAFTRITAIWFGRGYAYAGREFGGPLTITSVTPEGEVWVFTGQRSKVGTKERGYLCADTPANREIIDKIRGMEQEIKAIEARIKDAAASAERVFKD
jgi:hypothetical protein